ncbi:MAG TPA: hypothetical protein DEB39_06960 [Planctomycetaceae bacterium]|nr:hypothetical protein [Planctomycetaceae bacterium]
MASKPKKKKENPDAITEEKAFRICNTEGLPPEHIAWLLDSLGKGGSGAVVTRQFSGDLFRGKKQKMAFEAAIELELQRAGERREREMTIKLNRGIKLSPEELNQEAFSTEKNIYPKRVSPLDIGRSLDAARAHLADGGEKNMPKEQRFRAELLIHVIEQIKRLEALRVARRIARRQKNVVQGKTTEQVRTEKENEQSAALLAARQLEEERRKTERSIGGFGKGLHTLIDEAAEVVQTDYDASAKVLNQWIGNATPNAED